MNELRYKGYSIVFQEVPDEVTLAFNICGCPYKCRGCHSSYLIENDGDILSNDYIRIVNKYRDYITCVCFMGGDQNMSELGQYLMYAKGIGLKTCVYSGCDDRLKFNCVLSYLDYLKVGHYDEEKGALDSSRTNQRFYRIYNKLKYIIDITNRFTKYREV